MGVRFEHEFLFESPLLRVVDIRWRPVDGVATEWFQSPTPEITVQRRGMFLKRQSGRDVACDPGTLAFFNANEPYRMRHPVKVPCACTALLPAAEVLESIVSEARMQLGSREDELLCVESGPCADHVAALHGALYAAVRRDQPTDPLAIEETGLRLVRQAVHDALHFNGRARRRGPVRLATERSHASTVDAVRELLSTRFRDRLTLGEIARAVHCAPTHLCEIFKRHTGTTIHRYLTRLRLAAALETIADATMPLSQLAVDLGFSSHSHVTTSFRREFGVQPSRLRQQSGGPALVRRA
jgi:AraC-like DNA-binding protein